MLFSGPTALGDAVAFARRYALDRGLGERDQARFAIIVEELVTNLCEHGGCDGSLPIQLEVKQAQSTLHLSIADQGAPFDPRVFRDGVVPERGGGAGLALVNSWTDVLDYNSSEGVNQLRLSMPLASE